MEKEKKKYKYYTKAIRCPDGSRKYIRGKTQKELDEKVKEAERELEGGININDNTTFGQLTQVWIDLYKRPHNKPQSMKTALSAINNHLMPRLAAMRIRDIKPLHIAAVMLDASSLSKNVQATLLSYLRAIFNLAVDNQIIVRSPVLSTHKPSGNAYAEREALTPEQSLALLNEARKRGEWIYTYALLGLYTGMRSGEICGLCWDCVDFEAATIRVRRQVVRVEGEYQLTDTLKTPTSVRDIPAPPELMAHLRKLKSTTNTVTVTHGARTRLLTPDSASTTLRVMSGGLPFHAHPHLLRHTYATRLIEAGLGIKEVQYLLGHRKPDMTMGIYAHHDKKSRADATAKKVASVSFTA